MTRGNGGFCQHSHRGQDMSHALRPALGRPGAMAVDEWLASRRQVPYHLRKRMD